MCSTAMRCFVAIDFLLSVCFCMCTCAGIYQKVGIDLPVDEAITSNALNHMLLHNSNIYVGGGNRIFRLNFNLSLLVTKDTGPKDDNLKCDLPPDSCRLMKTPRNNINKVLLMFKYNNVASLITCGTVFQGACETRNLDNLEIKKEYYGMNKDPATIDAVAADTPQGSVVAFIAPGVGNSKKMYVATSYTGSSDRLYRENVPAISARKVYPPDEMFNFFQDEQSPINRRQSSTILIQETIRSRFIIEYVAGFTSKIYSYFLTTQPKSENENTGNNKRISKIIHLCQNDPLLDSYVDLPLVCKHGLVDYNLVTSGRVIQAAAWLQRAMKLEPQEQEVLVATFTDDTGNNSAVCVYSMHAIRKKVVVNARSCRNGTTSVNGNKYMKAGSDCKPYEREEADKQLLCHTITKTFARIAGIFGLEATPVIYYNNVTLTSVALSTTSDYTVAFLGTSQGQIKKIVIDSNTSATEYDTHLVDDLVVAKGSPINKDMYIDSTQQYLFAMTEKNIVRMRVENCEQYKSCDQCLSSRDPYCGWCTLENRCTVQSYCPNPDDARWTKGHTNKCIVIMNTSPPFASVSEVIPIHLTIMKLPRNSNYSCVFQLSTGEWSTPADRWSYGLNCRQTPNITSLGINFGPSGHKNITLGIRSLETGKLFVSRQFTFYNCKSFTSCTQCTDNSYSCDWCIYDNRCTYDPRTCDDRGIIVSRNGTDDNNNTRYAGGGRRGPLHCPHMNRLETEPIYIPNEIHKTISIRGHNFPDLLGGHVAPYKCIITNKRVNLQADCIRINSNRIDCSIPPRSYRFELGMFNADLKVVFGNNIEIDHDGVQVSIYSCGVLARQECSYCKYMEKEKKALGCTWCGSQCTYGAICRIPTIDENCPAPTVTSIHPINGYYRGGTRVTIKGSNLGSEFKDIEKMVTVADIPCEPIPELYEPSRSIVCVVGPSGDGKSGIVSVRGQRFPDIEFHYMKPYIRQIVPSFGPKSGGSLITIKGLYLNAGNGIAVGINGGKCATVGRPTREYVKCLTPPSKELGDAVVNASMDGKTLQSYMTFSYHEDPTIKGIRPLKSFVSGGRSLTITGTNFTIIREPRMFAVFNSIKSNETVCTVINSTNMTCPTPRISLHRLKRSTNQLVAEIGFIMDSVSSVRNLSANFPNVPDTLYYYPDPEVYNFTEKDQIKEFKGEVLIIRGKGLNIAAKKEDIRVYIGQKMCNITNLGSDEIYCTPPTVQPDSGEMKGVEIQTNAPPVLVLIGNRSYLVGFLGYEMPSILEPRSMLMYIIIGVSTLAFIIILAGVGFCCFYHRQKNQAKREFRKMQIQLDTLESNVRNECRQAFAELQTDMTDLTNDLDASKKPFYSFESYTFNVLFPGMLDHVILHPPMKNGNSIDRHPDVGIMHFSQLLQNKHFLLLLIRTLERQKSFSIRDKSNVASLLMILYQNNMEYATEILKTLLNDLVDKSVESRHPKLMLRRTESVVEKLLANWLSLCLYKYLVDSAGSSLYLLYKAIKVQVEKGPIDHVTNDARYSLSEDRLLRTEFKLEPEILSLNVEYEGKKYKCRVLDCDTITQAKEKMLDTIFRNFPYSQRPPAIELDLELTSSGRMLMDEDNTSLKSDGWKQLNVLKFYKVCDGADIVLTQHQNCRTMPRSPNGSVHSSGFSQREGVPITRTDSEVGCKIWHLVKQHDDSNNMSGGLKMSSEIYLTRLLSTKGTLKQYIDDFFETILRVDNSLPPVIKYLFDMMDQAACKYSISDPDVVHTWKCNSLLLRFWVNIIKNPNFVYDIHKPSIVDSCLSVVAQTFMDSCSTSEHRLGKDSPSNKLLFAKDIPKYRKWVEKYFADIQSLPAVSDQDLNAYLAEVSRMSTGHFTKENALYELYNYVQKYNNEINESLEADGFANAQQLPAKLGHVITAMEGPAMQTRAYV